MCLFVCVSQPTRGLLNLNIFRICRKGKRNNSLITELFLHLRKINGIFINSCRCSCFKAIHLDSEFFQGICQISRCLKSVWSCLLTDFSINTSRFQIRSCTQNNSFTFINCSGVGLHSLNFSVFCKNVCHFRLFDFKIFLIFQNHAHRLAVICFICLCSQRMYCRPL